MSLDLDPPPSKVELVASLKDKDNTRPDSIWKIWLNNLYEKVKELVAEELQKSAFGELLVGNLTPTFQSDFSYNINPDLWIDKSNNGTVTVDDHRLKLSTGAAANQSAQLNSIVPLQYHAGMGANVRFTGLFTTGVAGSTQLIGVGSASDGFFFGYNGADFGVLRRRGGESEVRTLTITTKSTTAENITITLDGDADATVAVTDATATDVTTTANEIAAHDYTNLGRGWSVYSEGAKVIFVAIDASSRAGTYSVAGTTVVGTFAQDIAGISATDTWVYQNKENADNWSADKGDGRGGLPVMDWTKGNVFQIRYQWLGYGMISFYVETPATGELTLVHQMPYANENTVLSVNNPTLQFCYLVENISNTTDIILMSGSIGGFTEGMTNGGHIHHGATGQKTAITTEVPILTILNPVLFQGSQNRIKIELIASGISGDDNKPPIFRLYKNATLTGASFVSANGDASAIKYDTIATLATGGDLEFATGLAKSGSEIWDLSAASFDLYPAQSITITAESTGVSLDAVASINWEDKP
jgi:hypothetical protein